MSQRLSKFDFFDGDIKVEINSILEPDIWVVQKGEFSVIWPLSHVLLVELMDSSALSSETFENVHSSLTIHEAESSHEVKLSVFPLFLIEFFCAEISGIR